MSTRDLPDAVDQGYDTRFPLAQHETGDRTPVEEGGVRLLQYRDGTYRVEHRCACPGLPESAIYAAPKLDPDGHRVSFDEEGRITVEPSIACSRCGLHGYARASVWVPA